MLQTKSTRVSGGLRLWIMDKPSKILPWQNPRRNLSDKKKNREIKISKLKWNLQKILDRDKER